jgi:hypothetical protein
LSNEYLSKPCLDRKSWGFVNIVAKALVKAGDKPDFVKIRRYINDIVGIKPATNLLW